MGDVPADLDAISRFTDWRDRVWWPVGIAESNSIAAAQAGRALTWAATLDDDMQRDVALLALPNILGYARAIVLAALATSRAVAAGVRLVGGSQEFNYLQTGSGDPPDRSAPILPPAHVRLEIIRRIARIRSWSSLARTSAALVSPDAVAVSHNPLLQQAASRSSKRIGFRHAESILAEARSHKDETRVDGPLASTLIEVLLGNDLPDEPWHGRAAVLLRAMAIPHLDRALHDMRGLRSIRLPQNIWSGSGGLYAPRAVGLEVLRRKGSVIRFDHGTPKGFVEAPEINALVEFSVSSEFVVASEAAADLSRRSCNTSGSPLSKRVQIRADGNDPTFMWNSRNRQKKSGKPRVVYAPTQLLGFRQLLPVQQPDVIHLNWQMQVVEKLRDFPVEFVCQPHPEGLFKSQPHPLESLASTVRGNFEEQLDTADVFVFDYPSTTALWEAACTDARIVFLDIGSGTMAPPVAKLFRERARVIDVAHDDGNRPLLDVAALRDAVLSESGPIESAPLRRMLTGPN